MNITTENTDELNAILKVDVTEADYSKQVGDILKDYRKKANLPGFRTGMVPFGMIKKMYGKSVLADELNKMVSDSIQNYITENKLDVLGQPIPKLQNEVLDLETQKDFNFSYELGLAPQFEIKLSEKDKYSKYKVAIDDALLEKNINDLAKRYGKVAPVEVAADLDLIQGEFQELNDKKEVIEGGITHTSTISLEYLDDAKVKKQFIGAKIGDVLTVDPTKVSKGIPDMAAMLNISKTVAEKLKSKFQFTVKTINHMEAAEINQDLFDKLFGKDVVKSIDEFKAKISQELTTALTIDADRKLKIDVYEKLMDKLKLSLPDAFLKKWLLNANEGKLTTEQIEEDYDNYAKSLKWQLIENKIIKENDLEVKTEEAINHAKELINKQMAQYGMGDMEDKELTETAYKLLQNQEESQKLFEQLYDIKILSLLNTKLTLKEKEVSYDEFTKLAEGKSTNKMGNLFNALKSKF